MAVVVALDAQWGIGKTEPILQLVERTRPGVVVGTAAQPVAGELVLGVRRDHLHQGLLLAPLRYPDGHALGHATRPGDADLVAAVGEEFLVDVDVVG